MSKTRICLLDIPVIDNTRFWNIKICIGIWKFHNILCILLIRIINNDIVNLIFKYLNSLKKGKQIIMLN